MSVQIIHHNDCVENVQKKFVIYRYGFRNAETNAYQKIAAITQGTMYYI